MNNLRSNLAEVRVQNDDLKAKEKIEREHFKNMEKKMLEMSSQVVEWQDQARKAEKEALEKQVKIDELEN